MEDVSHNGSKADIVIRILRARIKPIRSFFRFLSIA